MPGPKVDSGWVLAATDSAGFDAVGAGVPAVVSALVVEFGVGLVDADGAPPADPTGETPADPQAPTTNTVARTSAPDRTDRIGTPRLGVGEAGPAACLCTRHGDDAAEHDVLREG